MLRLIRHGIFGTLAIVAAGCTTARPVEGRRPYAQTWVEIGPRLASACGGCHGDSAAGGYRVTSYLDAIGATGGARVALAGDPTSPLLTVLDPATAASPHDGQRELQAALITWIVDDSLAYANSEVHAGGLLDPGSTDFHGKLVQSRGWDLQLCQTCHGTDFAGGASGATCNSCHAQKPTGCATCHGQPPATGAHLAHASATATHRALDCSECHLKPTTWDASGHIRDDAGALLPAPAVIRFGALAATPTPNRSAAPTFTAGRCDNVYCHGGAFADSAATQTSPSWSAGADAARCGTCHGLPPSGHPGGLCSTCHSAVVDPAMKLVAPSEHGVGKVSLGADGQGTCTSCHPNPGGAHAAHTGGPQHLAAPIACTECHVAPSTVTSPGHLSLDGNAAVFPTGGVGGIASAGGAAPSYDHVTGTCADVHCHGGGAALAADQSVGIARTPGWAAGASAAVCGACHGVPPSDGVHDAHWGLSTCSSCHPKTIDPSGALIVTASGSTHINGIVDVQP